MLYARRADQLLTGARRTEDIREGSGHLITFAPTRAGKGTGQIIPNLLTWQGSALVIDVKGFFGVDAWFGFGAVFGFAACAGMVGVAKLLGWWLKRDEDYYEAGDD